jgi:cyclopropane-fatty-acyl-phospholipid synthase
MVIQHHYDVSNRFYEMVLGESMTYTCAVYPGADATLEQAQEEKYDLVARKLGLRAGMRLLDVGCGWGGMVRHAAREYGVQVVGVTLSAEQAQWGQRAVESEGLSHLAEIRHSDYRDVRETGFDAISSIGSPSTSACSPTRSTSASCATICARLVDCSTTASPDRTTCRPAPVPSSTATSSPTGS